MSKAIRSIKAACFARLDYGKRRGGEKKVWLEANQVLDVLFELEQRQDALREALTLIANNPLRPDIEEVADAALAKVRGE